tara:strand:+ start:52 stop:2619 length:2568 start_codon:yes stop_codon:yes gene_type:complete
MAGFLNAFNKSFEPPGEQADIDPNEQRRYTVMAQEDLTRSDAVKFDTATSKVVGDVDSIKPENRKNIFAGVTVPSVGANGERIDFDASNLIKDGDFWVVGLKNPQTGEDTIVTDTSDANPNGNVTKFTSEQMNNALANKYNLLSSLSGTLDKEMIVRMTKKQSDYSYSSRSKLSELPPTGGYSQVRIGKAAIDKATEESINSGNLYRGILEEAEKAGDIFTMRGANVASKEELISYGSGASGATSTPVSPDQINEAITPEFESIPSTVKSTTATATTTGSSLFDQLDIQKAKAVAGQSTAFTNRDKDYPELKDTLFTPGAKRLLGTGQTYVDATTGVELVRAVNRQANNGIGTAIDLNTPSFTKTNINLLGKNIKAIETWSNNTGQPVSSFITELEAAAVNAQEAVDALPKPNSQDKISYYGNKARVKNLLDPDNIFSTALISENIKNDQPPEEGVSKKAAVALWRGQRNTFAMTDVFKKQDDKALFTGAENGDFDQGQYEKRVATARRLAGEDALNIKSATSLASINRNLKNDAEVHATIIGAAASAGLQTIDGKVSLNKDIYDMLYAKNWNIYTTGDPNISRKDLMSKAASGKQSEFAKWITETTTAIGTTDTSIETAASLLDALQEQGGFSFFGLFGTSELETGGITDEDNAATIASFRTASARGLELLTRLKEKVKYGATYSSFGNTVPDEYQGTIKRMEDKVARNLLIAGGLSRQPGGLAGWVASWGKGGDQFDAFTNLDNWVIVPSENGVTKNSRIMAIDAQGSPRETEFTVQQLQNSLNRKEANKLVSILLERQKNNKRTADLLEKRKARLGDNAPKVYKYIPKTAGTKNPSNAASPNRSWANSFYSE